MVTLISPMQITARTKAIQNSFRAILFTPERLEYVSAHGVRQTAKHQRL
jgi:hypothetical protein